MQLAIRRLGNDRGTSYPEKQQSVGSAKGAQNLRCVEKICIKPARLAKKSIQAYVHVGWCLQTSLHLHAGHDNLAVLVLICRQLCITRNHACAEVFPLQKFNFWFSNIWHRAIVSVGPAWLIISVFPVGTGCTAANSSKPSLRCFQVSIQVKSC